MEKIIGVVLGLASMFLVLSIFASHLLELLAAYASKRSAQLQRAIASMLLDAEVVRNFFAHPVIQSLATNPSTLKLPGRNQSAQCLPSYVPAETFCKVLQSVLGQMYAPAATSLTVVLQAVPESSLRTIFQTLMVGTATDADVAAAVQQWYSDTMDRVTGVYKKHSQRTLLILGFCLAVAINASVVRVTGVLWTSSAARDQATLLAQQYTADPNCKTLGSTQSGTVKGSGSDAGDATDTSKCGPASWSQLNQQLSFLPIGWTDVQKKAVKKAWDGGWKAWKPTLLTVVVALLGWLGTAVGVSFGAPFWFDFINQFLNLRLTGPKPDAPAPAGS